MSLSPMAPHALATMLPVSNDEIVFQYYIALDGSFQQLALDGAWKANINELPAQRSRTLRKKPKHPEDPRDQGEEWTAGVNILKEGQGIVYQSFLVLGGAPDKARLGSHKFEGVGQVFNLDTRSVASAPYSEAVIPGHGWLQCTVKPVQVHMDLKPTGGSITPLAIDPRDITPVVHAVKHFKNNTQNTVFYKPGIICEYGESIEYSVTDSHSFSIGTKFTWTNSANFGLGESDFSVELSFDYEESRSTTASNSSTKVFTVKDETEIPVNAGEEIVYSASIFGTKDAKADISIDFSLRGNLDNAPLPGDYLAAVANAMSATEITRTGPDSITYTVKGTVSANVATSSETEVARVAASTPVGSLAQ